MRLTDQITDESKTEEEALGKIRKVVASKYGDQAYIDAIDSSETEDEALSKIFKLANDPKPTKESQPLIDVPYLRDISTPDNIYKALDSLKYAAKPVATALTPITESIRAPFKYAAENIGENTSQTPPIDIGAEFKSIEPSSRAGFGPLIRDISNSVGIKTQPALDIKSKDYPKAAEFLKQMTDPSNIGAVAGDIALSKYAIPKSTESIVPKFSGPMSIETASAYLESITKDKALLQRLKESGDFYNIAEMVRKDPERYFHNFLPNKIYENIEGAIDKAGGTRNRKTGILNQLNRYQHDVVNSIPEDTINIDKKAFLDEVIKKAESSGHEATDLQSAKGFLQRNIAPENLDQKIVESIVNNPNKTTQDLIDYFSSIDSNNKMTVQDISKARQLGNKLLEMPKPGEMATDVTPRNIAGRSMESVAKSYQQKAMDIAKSQDQSNFYNTTNKQISNIINLKDLVRKNLSNTSTPDVRIPTGIEGSSGFLPTLARGFQRYVRPSLYELKSSALDTPNALTKGGALRPSLATGTIQQMGPARSTIPMFKIPRTTNEIVNNNELVKLKIKSEFGQEGLDLYNGAKTPQELSTYIYKLNILRPDIFVPSKYNTFDGKVLDPAMKAKALLDITRDKGSVIENAKKAERLIQDGIVDE